MFSKPNERLNRSLKLVCVCVTILGIVLLIVWGPGRNKGNGHAYAWTGVGLQNLGKSIEVVKHVTGQKAPITMPELATWLGECASTDDFIDYWGRPVVLVVHEGRLVALGSKGADGKWENGEGDDVYIDLNEMRKRWESRQPTSQPD